MASKLMRRLPPNVLREDVVADGYVGLLKAARDFDVSRGVPFWGFAQRRVWGSMVDGIRQDNRRRMYGRNGQARPYVMPLSEAIADTVADYGSGPYSQALANSRKRFIVRGLATGDRRRATCIVQRLKGKSLKDIGRHLGVTDSRVVQLIGDGVSHLKGQLQ